MEGVINQTNYYSQRHGYWETDIRKSHARKSHYFNGGYVGYTHFSNIHCQCHYINDAEIGCEQYRNSQFYYNKPNKKFGEKITWKK